MRAHGPDERDDRHRGAQPSAAGALGRRERLGVLRTEAALLLARVDAHGALASMAARGARPRGAAYRRGVPDRPPGLAGERAKRRMIGPRFDRNVPVPRLRAALPGPTV
jgi:hypothetical protein